jgi:hypothetical protein
LKGTCRKGARCPRPHDLEARTPDTTDDHQNGTSQQNSEGSKDPSQVQNPNEQEDSNQWSGSSGDGEIEAAISAANEELDPNDAESQEVQNPNEQEDSNQWGGSGGDGEIEAGVSAATEEPDPNDAESQESLHGEELAPESEEEFEPIAAEVNFLHL